MNKKKCIIYVRVSTEEQAVKGYSLDAQEDVNISFAKNLGYTSVLWSNAYDDWNTSNQGRAEYGKKKLLDNLHNGAVILVHSTSKDNLVLLDDFIKEARNMGYSFENLDNFE